MTPRPAGTRRRPSPAPGRPPQAAPEPRDEPLAIGPALRALAVVGPPVTIATSLLFYFGWATTAAQSRAMGLDESIFAMRTQDYVLRSLDALYLPIIALSLATLAWVVLHGHVLRSLDGWDGGRLPWVVRLARQAWWCWLLVAVALYAGWAPGRLLVAPLAVAVTLLLVEYRWRLPTGRPADDEQGSPRWTASLRAVLVGVVVTVLLFWEVAEFAEVVGRGRAGAMVAAIPGLTNVSVLSERDLQLAADGVQTVRIGDEGSAYRYRYDGLRLLQFTGDTWFLVPSGWQPGQAPLVALPEQESVRLEFHGAPQP